MLHHRLPIVLTLALLATVPAALAQPTDIPLSNPSFDDVDLIGTTGQTVLPVVFGWTETGPITTQQGFTGKLDTGIFVNTPVDLDGDGVLEAGPIPNVHGAHNQLAFMLVNPTADPEVTLSQPTAAVFTQGHQYQLTVALGQGVTVFSVLTEDAANPALFELAIGYFDGSDAFQTVAFRQVANEELGVRTGFDQAPLVDFDVLTDVLGAGDAALGENVAIQLRAADGLGGAWNIDNVRLTDIPEPGSLALLAPVMLALLKRK